MWRLDCMPDPERGPSAGPFPPAASLGPPLDLTSEQMQRIPLASSPAGAGLPPPSSSLSLCPGAGWRLSGPVVTQQHICAAPSALGALGT